MWMRLASWLTVFFGAICHCSDSNVPNPTGAPPAQPAAAVANGAKRSPGVVVGIAVGVIAGAVLVAVTVVFFAIRQRKKQSGNASLPTPVQEPGIRRLDDVESINPLSKKRSPEMPTTTKQQYANQIYTGRKASGSVSYASYKDKKSMDAGT